MTRHYVMGTIGGQRVAIEANAVESVIDIAATTPVPLAPPSVDGLCAVRSRVLTVIDVATTIGIARDPSSVRAASVTVGGHRYALRMARIDDAVIGPDQPESIDPSVGAAWSSIAAGRIETDVGFALVIDPVKIIERAGRCD